MWPLSLHNYFEIAALITSIVFWKITKPGKLRWLLPYLFFIVCVELLGRYIGKVLHQPNYWLYNITVPIEYLFFLFLFYIHSKNSINKSIIMIITLAFFLFIPINYFFIQGNNRFNTNFLKTGALILMIISVLFFLELLRNENKINPLLVPFFWIATGIFLFNAGEFIYTALSDSLFQNWKKWTSVVRKINNTLIYVLYTSIIIAVISQLWAQDQKK